VILRRSGSVVQPLNKIVSQTLSRFPNAVIDRTDSLAWTAFPTGKRIAKLGGLNARDGFRNGIEVMQKSARMMGAFLPGSGLFCDWGELDNKFEAFRLFQYADRELGLRVDRVPVNEVVRHALAMDAFRAIWIVEGIGYLKGTAASLSVEGLLNEGPGSFLPDRAMIPLHSGIGTAFGEKLLGGLGPNPSVPEIRRAIERFVIMCRVNCRPGWEDASIEALGLVVRCLYPHLLASASAVMEALDPPLRGLFWHGVGRALYFVPTNFLPIPGAHERMVRSATAEARRMHDRRQVLAGLIWAVTLVNLPRPAVIRSLLPICSDLKMQAEFTNGVVSALLGWRHMSPQGLRYLTNYTRPLLTHDREAALWNAWIETPAREALENIFPGLERQNHIPSLYTYRTPEELLDLSGVASEARI
jgi:hypothetical protein